MLTFVLVVDRPRRKTVFPGGSAEPAPTGADAAAPSHDEHRMRILLVNIDYRIRNRFDFQNGRLTWALDPDHANDLRRLEGYWELHVLGPDQTLAQFGTALDVGPALPKRLQDYITRKNVPESMERVRLWVDSDGAWRP